MAGARCTGQGTWEPHFGKNGYFRGMQEAIITVLPMAAYPWPKWQAWLPTVAHVRGTCGSPKGIVPSRVYMAAHCRACPWLMWLPMAAHRRALARVLGSPSLRVRGRSGLGRCTRQGTHPCTNAMPWHATHPSFVGTNTETIKLPKCSVLPLRASLVREDTWVNVHGAGVQIAHQVPGCPARDLVTMRLLN